MILQGLFLSVLGTMFFIWGAIMCLSIFTSNSIEEYYLRGMVGFLFLCLSVGTFMVQDIWDLLKSGGI